MKFHWCVWCSSRNLSAFEKTEGPFSKKRNQFYFTDIFGEKYSSDTWPGFQPAMCFAQFLLETKCHQNHAQAEKQWGRRRNKWNTLQNSPHACWLFQFPHWHHWLSLGIHVSPVGLVLPSCSDASRVVLGDSAPTIWSKDNLKFAYPFLSRWLTTKVMRAPPMRQSECSTCPSR